MARKLAFLVACALAALVLTVPAPAWAMVPTTQIYVNGVDITSDADNRVECGDDGYAAYDAATGVLTLNNAEITVPYVNETVAPPQKTYAGIYGGRNVNLNIVLV